MAHKPNTAQFNVSGAGAVAFAPHTHSTVCVCRGEYTHTVENFKSARMAKPIGYSDSHDTSDQFLSYFREGFEKKSSQSSSFASFLGGPGGNRTHVPRK